MNNEQEPGWFLPDSAINELMQAGVRRVWEKAKRANMTDVVTRKDSVETRFEADWIKHMRRVEAASPSSKSTKEADAILRDLYGAIDDPNIGWRGNSTDKDEFRCEFCGQQHRDYTKIPHTLSCTVPRIRAYIEKSALASSSIKEDGERADLGYMEAHGYTEDDLLHALAECRNAFPTPPAGGHAEQEWAQAMACPLHVPVFVKAALAAASSPPSPLGDTPDQQEQRNG